MDKENIFLKNTKESMPYISVKGGPRNYTYPTLQYPEEHVKKLKHDLSEISRKALLRHQTDGIAVKSGIYLEVSGQRGYELKYQSLEDNRVGIRLLNVKTKNELTKATIFIPKDKSSVLMRKLNEFENTLATQEVPTNSDLVRSIETINEANVESFWYGAIEDIPNEESKTWCEVWLRTENNTNSVYSDFKSLLEFFNIQYKNELIEFPERIVMMIYVNYNDLIALLQSSNQIAEFRRCMEPNSFFIKEFLSDQHEWVDDLRSRLRFEESNATVCLLDTGISTAHPLIEPFIQENGVHTVFNDGDLSDREGHGTEMAGIALYHDLNYHLVSREEITIPYRLESSKILRSQSNQPELYGAITKQGILFHEIENPDKNRSVCMAITTSLESDNFGVPTSWSAAIDEILADFKNKAKRLMYVSAGNVCPFEFRDVGYPAANINSTIENPGQSWNAITVGAYNSKIQICDSELVDYKPIAEIDALSPYSKTSNMWENKWPIKPEILMDGGNVAEKDNFYTECDDLSLLTTNHKLFAKLFSTIWATSSATAQASKLSAEIYCQYPTAWPETIRALMVHSARWTDKMKTQFLPNQNPNKSEIRHLLRTCGYGVPDFERAVSCKNNYVNMIIEEELQPFKLKSNGNIVMNELHIHKLPWPKKVLESLGNEEVELRVTLSYYIEPSPGNIGWKDRYSYRSCGLRFDIKNNIESLEDFKKRVNRAARADDVNWRSEFGASAPWYLGVHNRDVGSIHSDFMCVSAVELADVNGIAVYPVGGWWKERKKMKKYNEKVRYSLIVSLSTKETEVDLYTPIITEIQTPIQIEIS
ncbi:S8 family peptidase [Veillonella parvula]|uniref:S8 family peptidase n=1 Tax=Veillonella parvula TaxID=29466 RepID=UPI000E699625|nr:S8 family peptidase [Veillonella parvula]RIW11199.1 serine protease [Veillonella parvula]